MRIALIFSLIFWVLIVMFCTGCASLVGIKSYKSGDTEIQFITGYDIGAQANGIDTVNDSRGIAPGTGYNSGHARKEKY